MIEDEGLGEWGESKAYVQSPRSSVRASEKEIATGLFIPPWWGCGRYAQIGAVRVIRIVYENFESSDSFTKGRRTGSFQASVRLRPTSVFALLRRDEPARQEEAPNFNPEPGLVGQSRTAVAPGRTRTARGRTKSHQIRLKLVVQSPESVADRMRMAGVFRAWPSATRRYSRMQFCFTSRSSRVRPGQTVSNRVRARIQPGPTESNQSDQSDASVKVSEMRKIHIVFQKNLGIVRGGQSAAMTTFTCSLGMTGHRTKKIVKMLVKIFTMRQVFTRSGKMGCKTLGFCSLARSFLSMQRIRAIVFGLVLLCLPLMGMAAESAPANPRAPQHAEEGLPANAEHVGGLHIGPIPITNSMLVTWIVALALIIFSQLATRNMKEIPSGLQNFWEWMVESLYNFLEGIVGPQLVKKTFWFFATIFIFILFCNWAGLIPGIGVIGWGHQTPQGFDVEQPLFRGGNADLNMTLAMALVFFLCWIIWSFQMNGPIGFFKHLFGAKGNTTGFLKVLMAIVFFMVGWLEVLSILFRPVSLSFRLYGNIFAGENMLETMSHLIPGFGWLLPIPFYFMELLVGFIQALVFMLLTAVFTMLMAPHDDESHGKAHH